MQMIVSTLIGTLIWCTVVNAAALNQLPDISTCLAPTCTLSQVNIYWPSYHPGCFFECVQDPSNLAVWYPEVRACPFGQWFDYLSQNPQCVNFWDWKPVCPCEPCLPEVPVNPELPNTECRTPTCESQQERNFLHPADDRAFFYQCAPAAGGGFRAVRMPCAPGTWFGFSQQHCVWPQDWVDECGIQTTTSTTSVATTSSTSSTTTSTTTTVSTTESTTTSTTSTTTSSPVTTVSTPDMTTTTTTTTHAPPNLSCLKPTCTPDEIMILHPSLIPTNYYQCIFQDGVFTATERVCEGGLFFGHVQQACINPVDWINVCADDGGTTPIIPDPTPGPGSCDTPQCVGDEINRLHPHNDPHFFYQCAPAAGGGHRAVRMPCAPGTRFGYRQQVCVWPRDWEDACSGSITSDPTPTPTPTTTTTSTLPNPTPGPGSCETPRCVGAEINRLHPDIDPHFFYQCAPAAGGGHRAVRMPCAPGTKFGYRQQVCVWPRDWEDPCIDTVTPEPTTTITTSTTTTTTTTMMTTTTAPDLCDIPSCLLAADILTLHPHRNPKLYYECIVINGAFQPVEQMCSGQFLFGFTQQACVPPEDWFSVCPDDGMPTTTTQTTTSTTSQLTSTTTTPFDPTCPTPECRTTQDIAILHPHREPSFYYACIWLDDRFVAEMRMCDVGLLFGFVQQTCVTPDQWNNVCDGLTTTTTPTTTTTVTTTTSSIITTTTTTSATTTVTPDSTCPTPACDSDEEISRLHPHPVPSLYYECVFNNGQYEASLRMCFDNLLFGFFQQDCVPQQDWISVCDDVTTTTSQPVTTTTSQPITTTTSQPVTTTTSVVPPRMCEPPLCLTPLEISRLHPSFSPAAFYQCVFEDGIYTAVLRTCTGNTVFGNVQQACIPPNLWTDPCVNFSSTTTPPQTLPPIESCATPACSWDQVGIRWPSQIPRNFFECILRPTGTWAAEEIVCPVGMWFSYNGQECVPIQQWVGVCPA